MKAVYYQHMGKFQIHDHSIQFTNRKLILPACGPPSGLFLCLSIQRVSGHLSRPEMLDRRNLVIVRIKENKETLQEKYSYRPVLFCLITVLPTTDFVNQMTNIVYCTLRKKQN